MTFDRLLLRSLRYHLGVNTTVALGVAVGTAVLTGALLVGDSVKGSLHQLALDRLGDIDHVLVANRYFREGLADDLLKLGHRNHSLEAVVPSIFVRGTVQNPTTGARASRINVYGIDNRFLALFDLPPLLSGKRQVLLNEILAREIGIETGDSLLLRFQSDTSIPSELIMGRRENNVRTLRLKVSSVLSNRGLGRLEFSANQKVPLNIFLPLAVLQRALGKEGRANTIVTAGGALVDATASLNTQNGKQTQMVDALPHDLNQLLEAALEIDDLGMRITTGVDGVIVLETNRIVLEDASALAASNAALAIGVPTLPVVTYLANRIALGERSFPYSTVAALGYRDSPLNSLLLVNGQHAPTLRFDEILLNNWAAADLRASVGDRLTLDYYIVTPQGALDTKQREFKVKGIVQLKGLAADRRLAPKYEGMTDVGSMRSWNPPFPVDLSLVREIDEQYWNRYRATPKAFISFERAEEIWTSRFGRLTSIRISVPKEQSVSDVAAKFEAEFKRHLKASAHGLHFRAVKKETLNASNGATDFSSLFIGFSMFLIVSAAMLVTLLFQLGIERRSHEIGLLLSTGQTVSAVRKLLLKEAALVTMTGCLLGMLGAFGYGSLMVYGLSTWWSDAVGGSFLELHVNAKSLVAGIGTAFCLMVVTVWCVVKKFTSLSLRSMLAGTTAVVTASTGNITGHRARTVAGASLVLALVVVGSAASNFDVSIPGAFFGSGALLLISALAYFKHRLLKPPTKMIIAKDSLAIASLGVRNGARNPTRSMLSVALIASATFVIATVAMNRHDVSSQEPSFSSGNGGFRWIGESDLPIYRDQFEQSNTLQNMEVFLSRSRPGDDASCLNLYKPLQPTLLGVSKKMILRGGFSFQQTIARTPEQSENPWLLLEAEMSDEAIPVFGDANSVKWILHLRLGETLQVEDESGNTHRLVIAGLFSRSIFQSQLVMSEGHFLEMFPSHNGYNQFLIETDSQDAGVFLEDKLADQGFDAATTANRLASYLVVENTYLSTFQALGGLGLLFGTLGLVVVMVRNILERKRELALLQAVGFSKSSICWLILVENSFLLVFGVLIGFVTALLATAPHLFGGTAEPPWYSLTLTLITVVVIGLTAGLISVTVGLKTSLIGSLNREQ